MLNYHPVEAADAAWAVPLLEMSGSLSCEYAFVTIFMWSHVYHTRIARYKDWVVARSDGHHSLHYLYPAGQGDEREVLEEILAEAKADGRRLVLFSLSEAMKERLEGWFPGQFSIREARDNADYLYNTADLRDLAGKKYQKKRNHAARFERENPDWAFHEITPEAMPQIRQFNNEWCQLYDHRDEAGIQAEHRAIELVFRHYEELGLKGGYLTAGGQVVAFSFGSRINALAFDTHVEKARYDLDGAYAVINREMARAFGGPYQYINREDDLGEEGLRTSKLSYHPARLEVKYLACLKDGREEEPLPARSESLFPPPRTGQE